MGMENNRGKDGSNNEAIADSGVTSDIAAMLINEIVRLLFRCTEYSSVMIFY